MLISIIIYIKVSTFPQVLKTKIIKCIRIKKGKIKSVKIKQNKSRYCYFNKKMCIYITLVKNKQ